ncbi:hypothetical protein BU16DRAFT_259547 [Lophium mytilinum]|uniref:Uncharacterized protein n=1 Tax=Lophium mytilinum TaxID=390894 RepID=A0A6A6RBJ2_9PEZI|nr:hypothetical protein BU16DRAFT_259547 [Lophium mytilinum]
MFWSPASADSERCCTQSPQEAPISWTSRRAESPTTSRTTSGGRPKWPASASQVLCRAWNAACSKIWQERRKGTASRPLCPRSIRSVEVRRPLGVDAMRLSTRTTRKRLHSVQHHCVISGHLFREIRLESVPQSGSINDVPVTYLNERGVRVGCEVRVGCDACGRNVGRSVWQCELRACRQEVCWKCCLKLETAWLERAVASHG